MAWLLCALCSLSITGLAWAGVDVGACDSAAGAVACGHSDIELLEERESAAARVEMLQVKEHKQGQAHSISDTDGVAKAVLEKTDEAENNAHGKTTETTPENSLVSKDHNGNMCLLCGKPLAGRVDREYTEFRKDCGALSSTTGPKAEALAKPLAKLVQTDADGIAKNGFCQLNFAKSCADAAANKDYLYWAKSIDLKSSEQGNAAWDGHYCRLNGFLAPSFVALQHDFLATRAKAAELCQSKYSKYDLHNITFTDMTSIAKDKSAPSLEEAERLAAWNCAMGDLGCDMAFCAYSFCETGSGTGVYDECRGWHPVKGMPSRN